MPSRSISFWLNKDKSSFESDKTSLIDMGDIFIGSNKCEATSGNQGASDI